MSENENEIVNSQIFGPAILLFNLKLSVESQSTKPQQKLL